MIGIFEGCCSSTKCDIMNENNTSVKVNLLCRNIPITAAVRSTTNTKRIHKEHDGFKSHFFVILAVMASCSLPAE